MQSLCQNLQWDELGENLIKLVHVTIVLKLLCEQNIIFRRLCVICVLIQISACYLSL
jgi:hypothetical protein